MGSDGGTRSQAELIAAARADGRALALATGRVLGLFEAAHGPPLPFGRTAPAVVAFRAALRTMVGAVDLRQFPPTTGPLPADDARRRAALRDRLEALFRLLLASPACPRRAREGHAAALAALDALEGAP